MNEFSHLDWATNPLAMRNRLQGIEYLEAVDFSSCVWHANLLYKNNLLGRLALSLNDSRETHRLKLLGQLKASAPETYSKIVTMISELQLKRRELDPKQVFPCVATDEYLAGLPSHAQHCVRCNNRFTEGRDMIWILCGQHTCCRECYRSELEEGRRRFNGLCWKCLNKWIERGGQPFSCTLPL